jgi:hypothetical protein
MTTVNQECIVYNKEPTEPLAHRECEKTTSHSTNIKKFWVNFTTVWNAVRQRIVQCDTSALKIINILLTNNELVNYIMIDFTFSEINRCAVDNIDGLIEMYISPKYNIKNIPYMLELYNTAPELPNLIYSCYRPYNPRLEMIQSIDFGQFVVNNSDFEYVYDIVKLTDQRHVMNIVIRVKQPVASKILRKQKITVNSDKEREVYVSTEFNAFDIIIDRLIGEYNMIHHIGYIELYPEDDPLVVNNSRFEQLSDIKDQLEILNKMHNYIRCAFCNRHPFQKKIMACECGNIYYCSSVCKKLNLSTHKEFCIKK